MTRVETVIFDFDGVIGRTLEDGCKAWQRACSEVGLLFDREEFLLSEGRKAKEYILQVLARHGMSQSIAQSIVDRKNEIYREEHTFSLYDGIQALVDELRRRKISIAVVSGGSRARLLSGPSGDFLRTFDLVVTGDDVSMGKPFPDIFRKAADALGVSPESCLVIENAPLGIQAAKAAGMRCLAVCSTLPAFRLFEADDIFQTIHEVSDYLCETLPMGLDTRHRETTMELV